MLFPCPLVSPLVWVSFSKGVLQAAFTPAVRLPRVRSAPQEDAVEREHHAPVIGPPRQPVSKLVLAACALRLRVRTRVRVCVCLYACASMRVHVLLVCVYVWRSSGPSGLRPRRPDLGRERSERDVRLRVGGPGGRR